MESAPRIARHIHGEEGETEQETEFRQLIDGVQNNHHGLVDEMLGVSDESRWKTAQQLGYLSRYSRAYQDFHVVVIPPRLHHMVERFSAKLAKSLYYKHVGRIFPTDGIIQLKWITNVELTNEENWFATFTSRLGGMPVLRRSGTDLADQFNYLYAKSDAADLAAFSVMFGNSIGITTLMLTDPTAWARITANAAGRGAQVDTVFTSVDYP